MATYGNVTVVHICGLITYEYCPICKDYVLHINGRCYEAVVYENTSSWRHKVRPNQSTAVEARNTWR